MTLNDDDREWLAKHLALASTVKNGVRLRAGEGINNHSGADLFISNKPDVTPANGLRLEPGGSYTAASDVTIYVCGGSR